MEEFAERSRANLLLEGLFFKVIVVAVIVMMSLEGVDFVFFFLDEFFFEVPCTGSVG